MADGRTHFYDGKRLIVDGKTATADDCCCSSAAPLTCPCDITEWTALVASGTPCHNLVASYQIANYTDGDLQASLCTSCINSGATAWAGVFGYIRETGSSGYRCRWDGSPIQPPNLSIDGKAFDNFAHHPDENTRLRLYGGKWLLKVVCDIYPGTHSRVWEGEKTTGDTPVGVYTRTSGCDTTPTLTIEET